MKQGKPVSLPKGKEIARSTMAMRVEDEGESQCRSVIERIWIERKRHDPARKRADFPRVFYHERT